MSGTELELGIVAKVMTFMNITEKIDEYDLYDKLMLHRNQLHPDQYLDKDAKQEANKKFIQANHLLTDLNSYVNRENLSKPAVEMIKFEKKFELMNTNQKIVEKDNKIEYLETRLRKYKKLINQLFEQQKILSREKKENEYKELRSLYKKSSRVKIGIGVNLFFGLLYSFIINIDRVSSVMEKYIPIPPDVFNTVVFLAIGISILVNIRKLVQNAYVGNKSKMIESTMLIDKFSKNINKEFRGSKISEIGVFNFIRDNFTSKSKAMVVVSKIFGLSSDIVIEKYKNIFINTLLEKQLIKISRAKSLDREFYVYGSSWDEQHQDRKEVTAELLDEGDIETMISEL